MQWLTLPEPRTDVIGFSPMICPRQKPGWPASHRRKGAHAERHRQPDRVAIEGSPYPRRWRSNCSITAFGCRSRPECH